MNISGLELSILLPAFLAGLLVLATHVPLGMQVLSRGIVFIDLAIAQIAGLGVIAADLLGFEAQGIGVQISRERSAVGRSVADVFGEALAGSARSINRCVVCVGRHG